jgi:hypothetical protein
MKNLFSRCQQLTWLLAVALFMLSAPGIPTAHAATLFDSFNTSGVSNGPSAAAVFSVSSAVNVTEITTYHWNNGSGSTPGTISLRHSDGTVYGPWTAVFNMPGARSNTFWTASPNASIKAGTYTVIDSGTATWSHNSTSGNAGFVLVKGDVVTATSYTIFTVASPTAGGGVTCSPNPVSSGSNSTCTATANSGYTVAGWSGDCSGTSTSCTLSNVISDKTVTAFFTQSGSTSVTGDSPTISLTELADLMPGLGLFPAPPRQFRLVDPLGIEGIDATNAWAAVSGDVLRIHDLKLGGNPYSADFLLKLSNQTKYELTGAAAENTLTELTGTPISGLDTSPIIANLVGPPLRLSLFPVNLSGQAYVASFAFNPSSSAFLIEGVTALPATRQRSTRGYFFGTDTATTIDELIAEKTRVATEIPSDTDWGSTALSCITGKIGAMDLGDYGLKAELLQIVASEGPGLFLEMREQAALGNTLDAELVVSQLLWKGLAKGIEKQVAGENGNAYGKALVALANYSGHGGAVASALGTSGVGECALQPNYKEALKVALEGMVSSAAPMGRCIAEISLKVVQKVKNVALNVLADKLYKGYEKYTEPNDAWVDFDTGTDLRNLILLMAQNSNPSTSPYQITDSQRDKALTDIKGMFARWKVDKANSSSLKTRLVTLKQRFQDLTSSADKQSIASRLPENERTEAHQFWRYVELMMRARAKLVPYVPSFYTAEDKDIFAHGAVVALLRGGEKAWNEYIAAKLQEWEPKIFAANPMTCARLKPTTASGVSGEVAYAYKEDGTGNGIGIKYTISGGSDLVRTPVGNTSYATYSGKLVGGSTLTVAGSGWSIPEWKVSMTSFDKYPMWLEAKVTVDGDTKTYDYYTPKGESMNTSFSLSVPIPADAQNGSFGVSVCWRSAYRDQCAEVGGSLRR